MNFIIRKTNITVFLIFLLLSFSNYSHGVFCIEEDGNVLFENECLTELLHEDCEREQDSHILSSHLPDTHCVDCFDIPINLKFNKTRNFGYNFLPFKDLKTHFEIVIVQLIDKSKTHSIPILNSAFLPLIC